MEECCSSSQHLFSPWGWGWVEKLAIRKWILDRDRVQVVQTETFPPCLPRLNKAVASGRELAVSDEKTYPRGPVCQRRLQVKEPTAVETRRCTGQKTTINRR